MLSRAIQTVCRQHFTTLPDVQQAETSCFLQRWAEQQQSMACARVFFGARLRYVRTPRHRRDLFDGPVELVRGAHFTVVGFPFGVVEGFVGRLAAKRAAEEHVLDVQVFQQARQRSVIGERREPRRRVLDLVSTRISMPCVLSRALKLSQSWLLWPMV